MLNNDINDRHEAACSSFSKGLGQKLAFLLLGGGVGATIALLFAPKPGNELRQDIAEAASKSYEESLEAAERLKLRTAEYYQNVKEKSGEILDVVGARVSTVKEELGSDLAKIGEIVESPAKMTVDTRERVSV